MDTLVVIGDLTASESFTESSFFVQNDLYKILKNVLASSVISKIEPVFNTGSEIIASMSLSDKHEVELTKLKFWEIIVWTVANSVADDAKCQTMLLERHEDLIETCFSLAQAANEKINLELCFMLINLFKNKQIKRYLFGIEGKKKRQQCDSSYSSFKESDRGLTNDGGSRGQNRTLNYANEEEGEVKKLFVRILEVLTRIIKDRPISRVQETDDSLDY